MRKVYLSLLLLLTTSITSFSQTGPAGVGNSGGTDGQPRNVLWLRADLGVTTSGGFVDAWADQTTNGLDASQSSAGLRPSFSASNPALNGLPSMNFLPGAAANYHLAIPDNDLLDDSPGMSFFIVLNPSTNGTQGILNKRTDAGVNQAYRIYRNGGTIISNISNGANASITVANSANIFSSVYDQTAIGNKYNLYVNSTNTTGANVTTTLPNRASPLYIGNFDLTDNRSFNGDIAEIIIYNEALNQAERIIVENYLSEKYDLSIGGNDFFGNDVSFDASFVNDLRGIGTADGSEKQSTPSDFSDALLISELNNSLNASNEFIFFGHDNATYSDVTTNITVDPGVLDSRWERSWYFEVNGSVSTEFRFDFGEAGRGVPTGSADYVLLYRATTSDQFTRVAADSYSIENTDQLVVDVSNLDLPTGYYTLGIGEPLTTTTWYSFQSGDWNDPLTWTTVSNGAVREPVMGGVPTSGDNAFILSGRTVTMDSDDNDGVSLTVNGRLDIGTTADHNFFNIAGNGTISLAGDGSNNDNFPSGSTAVFADSIVGGTVEIVGTGVNLNAERIFNNVIVNLTNPTDIATLLADYRLNGDLTIQNGIFRINDNTETAAIEIDVFGNTQIDASGEINVGTANARHQFNFYGDLINNGRLEFTNRVAADNNTEATNGIVDANFLSGVRDQSIECNGVTNFYRIEIDKGADETYILDINATSAANFNLFGPVNYSFNGAQLADNSNALGLIRGTVRLNTNVDVPLLNNTGNYCIFESARLWVNGGSTTKTGGAAVVPYGTLQVSDGTFDVPVSSGITTRDNGTIIVEGGIVTVNQIRTSVQGELNIGGYFQSGGEVNVTGQAVNEDYYTFSLTYSGNTFNMSGGTLRVAGSDTFEDNTGGDSGQIHGGGIFINSDPGNISVTGGTVIMENNTNVNFKVTSKAPFWNVFMRSTGGTATEVDLDGGTSGDDDPGEFETILAPELLVLNDLTIEDGVTFDHNGFDVEIGSDFNIQTNGDYVYDNGKQNTTTINGVDNAILNFQNRVDGNGEQRFWNLIINKPVGRTVSLASGKADLSGSANNLVRIDGDALKILSGTFDNGEHSIRIFADSLVNYDVLGVYDPADANAENDFIKLTDQPITLVTADTSRFGNVRFNNTNDIVELTSDVFIQRFQYRFGRMNLGEHNLKIDALDINLRADRTDWNGCGGCFSVEDMFITDGNASDGGLSLYVPADGLDPEDGDAIFDFPFGIGTDGLDAFTDTGSGTGNSKYTPASVTISGVADDGYITIRPVDNLLPTTDPAGGDLLSYYWTVDFEDFSTLPSVEYQFTYYDNDLDGSANEATFAAGKVLDLDPFTRSYEDDPVVEGVDDTNNTITFNGSTDTGFTIEAASYTAGEFGRFVGAPEIYYSRADGNWNNTSTWSTVGHTSSTNTGTFPQAGDVAIVSFNGTNFHRVNAVGDLDVAILEFNSLPNATAKTIDLSRVLFGTTEDLNADIVRGIGELQFAASNGNGPSTINANADLGDFVDNKRSSFIYTLGGTGDITIPAIDKYPSIRFFANGANDSSPKTERFFLDKDIECGNLILDGNAVLEVTNDILVTDTLFVGANRDGELIFNNGAVSNTVETGYLIFGSDLFSTARQENVNRVLVESGGGNAVEHRLIVNNDIVIATGSNGTYPDTGADFDLFTNASDNNVILELAGEGTNNLEIEGDDDIGSNGIQFIPEFYRIVVNKGTDVTSFFAFNDGFTLQGSTSGATKALTLQNGLLVLNSDDNDINIDLTTGGGDFDIPGSAGLQVSQAQVNVSGDDTGIILDGSLIIDGGTVNMDDAVGNGNNFIEYSASGNALLEISAGTLDVGSQIRGITSAETGVLRYRQTGGDVRIGTQAGPENTRGMLQIYNTGSEFTYTGGTLTIERHQDSPSVAALFLDPDISDVTGSNIIIFNGNTPAGQNDFRINSVIALENLTINGTNSPSAEIDINSLTVSQLTIAAGGTLNGNGRTLTVGGDFVNDGTYDAQNNETIFNSTTVQEISGSGTNSFFKFTKEETGTLNLTNNLDVADLFTISEGTLADNGFAINLSADAVIDGTHTSGAGNGIVFAGGASQELRRSAAGTGELGILTINNTNGVVIPDGNGYNFNINNGLRLENGVFNVGGSAIVLGVNAEIEAVNSFGVNNMIRTNTSFVDNGITKIFPASYNTDFTFPVGQAFYTPAIFDFTTGSNTSGSTSGSITILPANEFHPTVDDGADALGSGDVNNVLQYYWTVRSSGLNGFTTDMSFQYDQSDVLLAEGGAESDYIAARILSQNNPTFLINKFTNAEVDEASNIITFDFAIPGVSDDGIAGDYFAGISAAIPDNVAIYTVNLTGIASDPVYTPAVPGGGIPSGAVVIVPNTFTLTLNQDNTRFYATEIQDGGVLEVDNSTNHRLGELTGTGTLRILSNGINANLPAFSGNFLSCSGGSLEYGGTGDYGVMSGITQIRNLSFIDSGVKTFANNNVRVCENLTVDGSGGGPVLTLADGRNLNIDQNFIVNNGTINSGTSIVEIDNDFTLNGGSYDAENGGSLRVSGDMAIQGGDYLAGSSGNLFLEGNMIFSSGNYTTGGGTHRVRLVGNSNQNISGVFTGGSAFYRLELSNSTGVSLTGGAIEIQNALFLNNGLINTNGFPLTILSSAAISPAEGRTNSYVNGRLSATIPSGNFVFPIGSSNVYRPAAVYSVSAGGLTWEAEYFQTSATDEATVDNFDPTDPSIVRLSSGEYWKISDGNDPSIGTTATVGLSWGIESDVSADASEREQLEVMIWNPDGMGPGVGSWDNLGGQLFSAGNTQDQGSFRAASSNTFSEQIFTLGSSDAANPLPITLSGFTGKVEGDVVLLDWTTSAEINNDYFELQRSADGINYETIATIDGSGNTNTIMNYTHVDNRPLFGKNYYRLKQVDFNGDFSIPEQRVVVDVTPDVSNISFTTYPNPTQQGNINLRIEADQRASVQVQMFDMFGRVLLSKEIGADQYRNDISINPDERLNQGIYIISVEQLGKKIQKRIIINK